MPSIAHVARVPILAVDDNPANLLALQALPQQLDVNLVAVESGARAIEECAARDFAVILLDVMMPKMDGFETLQRLRSLAVAGNTAVITYSATPSNTETGRSLSKSSRRQGS